MEVKKIDIKPELFLEFKYYCVSHGLKLGFTADQIIRDFLISKGVYNFKKEKTEK